MLNVYIIAVNGQCLYSNWIDDDSEFEAIEEKTQNFDEPVCIKWDRPSDGQVAYYSPNGACFDPYWYNSQFLK